MRKHHVLVARKFALLRIEDPRGLHAVFDAIIIFPIDEVQLHLVLTKTDIRVFEDFEE